MCTSSIRARRVASGVLGCVLLLVAPVPTSAQGTLALDTVHGYALEETVTREAPDRTVAVYTPPSYSRSPERRYAVLYLLHGIGGTHRDWTATGRGAWSSIQDVMDRAIARSRVAEFIVVAPDQNTRGGGSFYTNSAVTGGWEDFTVHDLVRHVDEHYRTHARAASRGIAGHSMGGYGAIKLGMKHPDVFQVVYGLNSGLIGWAPKLDAQNSAFARAAEATPQTLNPRQDFWPASLLCVAQAFSPNPERPPFYADLPFVVRDGKLVKDEATYRRWSEQMPLYMVEDHVDNLRRLKGLRFDSGRADEFAHIPTTNLRLSERLEELEVPHVFEDYNGDHRDKLWGEEGRIATEVLPYFSRLLQLE